MAEIRYETVLPASPEAVYDCFVNSGLSAMWMSDNTETTGRLGSSYLFSWNDGGWTAGNWTKLDDGKALSFTWYSGEPAVTDVSVTFEPADGGCRVTVTHAAPDGEVWADAHSDFEAVWKGSLNNLRYLLETGFDRRFAMRPMMGVLFQELDADLKAKLGVPIDNGLVIEGTVPGSGAEQAGLLKDDVLHVVDGETIERFESLSTVIRRRDAGDVVRVEYYRGGAPQSTDMTFGKRPLPALAASHEALVQTLEQELDKVCGELDTLIGDLPEAVMAHKPGPKEWSISDQLAHLIISERSNALGIWTLCGGDGHGGWGGNNDQHLAGLQRAYQTGAQLLEVYKKTLQELIGTVEAIPERALRNPAMFNRIAWALSDPGGHTRQHIEQMRGCIESAKALAAV